MANNSDPAPAFLITIDTEGDCLWSRPKEITTKNARFLPRFQQLCERYALKPVYLANFEMACCPVFQAFGKDVLARGTAEIGMHLHAWNSPPLVPLTRDDFACQPYLIEYPDTLAREKVRVMTRLLMDTFETPITSHRAGRWAFDKRYAHWLIENDYKQDCSVTPHVSWKDNLGNPGGSGGSDYRNFPEHPYLLNPDSPELAGASDLLEIPVTILENTTLPARVGGFLGSASWCRPYVNRVMSPVSWLRPTRSNSRQTIKVLRQLKAEGRECAEFMLHSSELMPGGSPTFPDSDSVDRLYTSLEELFQVATSLGFRGSTMDEFGMAVRAAYRDRDKTTINAVV